MKPTPDLDIATLYPDTNPTIVIPIPNTTQNILNPDANKNPIMLIENEYEYCNSESGHFGISDPESEYSDLEPECCNPFSENESEYLDTESEINSVSSIPNPNMNPQILSSNP